MEVLAKLANSTTIIPNVHWHTSFQSKLGYIPAGCYVMKSSLKRCNDNYNKTMKDFDSTWACRTLDDFINSIECAEMPFDILDDCDCEQPWKCFGITAKEVPYGMDDHFWKNMA